MKILFRDKGMNYIFAVISWIIFYFLLLSIFRQGLDWQNGFWKLISFIASALIVFLRNENIPIMTRKKLLFTGSETGMWVEPGFWFKPLFYSFAEDEVQKTEKKDVIILAFKCQDKNGKVLVAEANGDWKITVEGENNYKEQDASKMEGNLQSLIKRTIMRICGKLDYKTEILGESIGEKVLHDPIFERECINYGIAFHNLIANAIADNLNQENLNSYHDELFTKEKSSYPLGHVFTHQEIEEIETRIQIKLGQAKKIVTNSALLGRYDIKD